jgi:hypothetical protein
VISAGEATDLQQAFDPQKYDFRLGDADIWISNVSPHEGGVEFILHVGWGSPLNVAVDITELDPLSTPGQYIYP